MAASKAPVLSFSAPVKEPLTWPKNSEAASSRGMVPQSTATKGLPARLLLRWMSCATCSLPVPLAPLTSTDMLVGATSRTYSYSRREASLCPSM